MRTVLPQVRRGRRACARGRHVIVCDVHEWHGNLPLKAEESYQRLSIVAYVREKLALCTRMMDTFGVPEDAIIKPGDPIEYIRPRRVRQFKRKFTWRIQKTARCLQAVADYAHKFGRVPPVGTRHLDIEVGAWCFNRRIEKRTGKLSVERALEIERVVPGWTWEPERRDTSYAVAGKRNADAASFAETLGVLERFIATHGRLPRSREGSEEEHGAALGKWVVNRRQDIKKGKASADAGDTRDWPRLAEILGMSLGV